MLSGTNGRLLRLSLQAAANGLVRNRLATVAATVTMTLMLLVLASVLVIRAGLDAALAYADSKVEVVAYLKLDATEAIADRLSAEIRGIDGVREIRFVSAEEALKEFRQRLVDRGEPDLTGDAGGNPLPASLEIALNDPLDTARVADALRTIPSSAEIERIIDGRVLAENLAGRVADVIVRQARRQRADLLVLGTHGRRGLTRMVMGSDAELVVRYAPAPVLLVRAAGGR